MDTCLDWASLDYTGNVEGCSVCSLQTVSYVFGCHRCVVVPDGRRTMNPPFSVSRMYGVGSEVEAFFVIDHVQDGGTASIS